MKLGSYKMGNTELYSRPKLKNNHLHHTVTINKQPPSPPTSITHKLEEDKKEKDIKE